MSEDFEKWWAHNVYTVRDLAEKMSPQQERLKTVANIGWDAALSRAEGLCRIYFEIAAEAIGEDVVREKRDQRIKR